MEEGVTHSVPIKLRKGSKGKSACPDYFGRLLFFRRATPLSRFDRDFSPAASPFIKLRMWFGECLKMCPHDRIAIGVTALNFSP
jgi:hypothetical protein